MSYVRKLLILKGNAKNKKELYKKLKQLRKIFDDDAKELCHGKFKKKAYYLYRIARAFIWV